MKYPLALVSLILAAAALGRAISISHVEIPRNSAKSLRPQFSEDSEPVWKTDEDGIFTAPVFPPPSHQSKVKPLLSQVSTSSMQDDLSNFTNLKNRWFQSQGGVDASAWILNKVKNITNGRSDITAEPFIHDWPQNSIILRFAGTSASFPVTILGAHMDSLNWTDFRFGRAPGADDDGSGTVNLLEALRVLVSSGFKPSTPLEFHWYAGEEAGIRGSREIAKYYHTIGAKVKAVMQLDMTAYFKPGSKEVIALTADYVDTSLNEFLGQLIDAYSRIPWVMSHHCPTPCSDYGSWNEQGYRSAMPYEAAEGDDNPYIHTINDTTSVDGFSWEHTLEFAKLAVAFAYEMTV